MSKKRNQRRGIQQFSLSFLDVVCCAFGAVILLLILSKYAEPTVIEQTHEDLTKLLLALENQQEEVKGETDVLNRELKSKQEQLAQKKAKLARLQGDLSAQKGQYASTDQHDKVQSIIEGKLVSARQQLTAEMRRLRQKKGLVANQLVGGIPVDSEYIIFVIDTSGSMRELSWRLVIQKVYETLSIYPEVRGIQVLNDMGNYMFPQYRDRWIPDSPARRKAILDRLRTWDSFSNSSPIEGISKAINTFYAKDKRISVYVFGDDFTGPSIDTVVAEVDRLNHADSGDGRRVRIHGVGFPALFTQSPDMQRTSFRFATLMRILCERNGGTFVGLSRIQ